MFTTALLQPTKNFNIFKQLPNYFQGIQILLKTFADYVYTWTNLICNLGK